jgi:hypothetical protein
MEVEKILEEAKKAKNAGAERFCMGAGWRKLHDRDTEKACEIVAEVKKLGLETCMTLGMLSKTQAVKLKEAGHKLILWTNRGDNEEYKSVLEAIEWCKNKGLEFDCINKNLPETEMKKISGYSPKIMADYYIDDKALAFNTSIAMSNTLSFLQNIRDIDNEQM